MSNNPAASSDAIAASLARYETFFGASLVEAAQVLIEGGSVSNVRVLQNGRIITGHAGNISGHAGNAHRVYVQVRSAGTPPIEGECSCGETGPCVHIAAVVLAANAHTTQPLVSPIKAPVARPQAEHTRLPGIAAQHLIYWVEPCVAACESREQSSTSDRCQLSIWVTQSAADNCDDPGSGPESGQTLRHAHPFAAHAAEGIRTYPRYVDADDREILAALTVQQPDGPWPLSAAPGFALLRQAVATGRAFWQAASNPLPNSAPNSATPLRIGAARPLSFAWEVLPDGNQRLRAESAATLELLLMFDPIVYIDRHSGACGPIDIPYSAERLRQYWHRNTIPPEEVALVNAQLMREAGSREAGAADLFPRLRTLEVRPWPLRTLTGKLTLTADLDALLHFVYNGKPVGSDLLTPVQATVRQLDGDAVREIERNFDTEARLNAELRRVLPATPRDGTSWLAFMMNGVPALQTLGWEIEVDANFPYRLAETATWYADLETHRPLRAQRSHTAHRSREWFDLQLGVVVDDQPVNLLPALVRYLQGTLGESGGQHDALNLVMGEHLLIKLEDGRYLPVTLARLQRIADTLVELHDHDGLNGRDSLTLPAAQASRLAQLAFEPATATLSSGHSSPAVPLPHADRSLVLRADDPALLARIDALEGFSGIVPLAAPTHFDATLRPYQQEGLGWLQFLRRTGLGGVLADDMGLGKTVQTLAHLALEKQADHLHKPSLIVAPVSVLGNWQQEIRRFAPDLTLLTLHGAKRKTLFPSIARADIVLIGYPLLLLDSELLLPHDFYFLILDEAQTIKNPQAKISQVARSVRADHRLCLTGTPMENHLGELWSLFDFVQPGLLGDRQSFQRYYRTPIENGGDTRRAAALSRRIQPFLLRRTKDAVARDLPPKIQIVEPIELDERQRDFYDGIRLGQHRRVQEAIHNQGLARSHITVLDALLKMRQACCDPRLVKTALRNTAATDTAATGTSPVGAPASTSPAPDIPSAKLDWLRSTLPELIDEGRRILLFSQFTSMLRLIEAVVDELRIPHYLLTGDTQNRTELVDRFQAGRVPLFLISLKAGGTGLNLTAADTIIHYDPWWNPAVEAQAADRAHRIGQDKTVFVYKLIAQGTVEEKMMQLQADKHALMTQLYTEKNAAPTALRAEDLESLFAP